MKFVIDASVALSWCFPDEDTSLAGQVAAMFQRGDTALVPSFWPHEVLNALLAGEKRKRISKDLTHAFLDDLATLPIVLESSSTAIVFDRIRNLARTHSLTAYDAAYLDLAAETGLPLATLDADLRRACRRARVQLL